MIKIDFSKFPLFTGIEKNRKEEVDVRKDIADRIYTSMGGIAAHDLAYRVYRSTGPVELSADDVEILELFAQTNGTPAFQDSLAAILK